MSIARGAGALVGLALVGALLTACVTATTAEPSVSTLPSSPPAAPDAPSPTPAIDPIDTVETIVVRPETIELRDDTGAVVLELDYLEDMPEAIATIERVIGIAPVSEEHPASNHYPPSTVHRWGGLEIWEQRYVDYQATGSDYVYRWSEFADHERTLARPAFKAVLIGPDADDIALTTDDGIVAGSAWVDLEATPELQINPSGCSGPYLDYTVHEETWPDGTVHDKRNAVDFTESEDGTSIAWVRAPVPIHEDGCA